MNKQIFNVEALVSVGIKDKKECPYVQYVPYEKHFMGHTKEGVYYNDGMFNVLITEEQMASGVYGVKDSVALFPLEGIKLLAEDKKAYFLPYVQLTFAAGKSTIETFNSYAEALAWGNEMAEKGMNVRLEFAK